MSSATTTRAATGPNEDPSIDRSVGRSVDRTAGHTKALTFIQQLAERDPSMPLGAILVLIYLYGNRQRSGGVSLKKLKEDLGMSSTIASRSLYYWSESYISVQINPRTAAAESKYPLNPDPQPDQLILQILFKLR